MIRYRVSLLVLLSCLLLLTPIHAHEHAHEQAHNTDTDSDSDSISIEDLTPQMIRPLIWMAPFLSGGESVEWQTLHMRSAWHDMA